MLFRVLGPMQVETDDGVVLPITAHRQMSVLAILLIARGNTVTADRLIEDIWGDSLPANPANTLQNSIAQLRKTFDPNRSRSDPPTTLVSSGSGYRLDLDGHSVDAPLFESRLDAARAALDAGHPDAALIEIERGLELWRGDAYVDFLGEGFADVEADRLAARRLEAVELAIDARLANGESGAVVAELESLVAEHPHREETWGRLMLALYQSGRQADALRTFRRAETALGEELGIDVSPELRDLEERILLQDPSLAPIRRGVATSNLPAPVDHLIGREKELDEVATALGEARLTTLIGPGGSGKTRLALEAGWRASEGTSFPDGVWLVALDDLQQAPLLDAHVGAAIRMPESAERDVRETLGDHLSGRRTLLVLDNCEHLVESVGDLVSDLLQRAPRLSVLATSQVALDVAGEHRIAVQPLAVPGEVGGPFAQLDSSPAVELFVERARQVVRDREFGDEDMKAVANIVTALDGMPLAIELAAARTAAMSPAEIARMMGDRFALLTSGPRDAPQRQQSLRETLQWSHQLLDESDQDLFSILAAFVGGFDHAAAAALAELSLPETVDLVDRLGRASFLVRSRDSSPSTRFRMLETLRHYGLDQLEQSGRGEAVRSRHARHFAERSQRLSQALTGAGQADAMADLLADEDNYRAALTWCLDHTDNPEAVESAIHIAARLGRYWDWRGSLSEASSWLARLAPLAGRHRDHPDAPYLVSWHAFFTSELGDNQAALDINASAVAIAESRDDMVAATAVRCAEAVFARVSGDEAGSLDIARETLAAADTLAMPWFAALSANNLALAHLQQRDFGAAATSAEDSRDRFVALGDVRGTGWAMSAHAQALLGSHHPEEALRLAVEAADLAAAVNDGRNAAWASQLAATAARVLERWEDADRYAAAADELLSARGMPIEPWRATTP